MNNKVNPVESAGQDVVTAALLVIGDEILSGRTKDKNIGAIADHLTEIGVRLSEVRVVPDEEVEIVDALNAMRARYHYVFTTGGIGPTHDDITADAVAQAFGVSIDIDPRAVAIMRQRFSQDELTPARLRMTRIPAGAELVENSVSLAPGFFIGNVIVMAGVPNIMESMLKAVTPKLRTGTKLLSITLHAMAPEGRIAPFLSAAQDAYPDVKMGSYPYVKDGRFGVHLVLRAVDQARLETAMADLEGRLGKDDVPYERIESDQTQ
ncbi:MAG: competence/damage-inducible protein A [Hyphomicrobiales bacterium]|nr:competence/damage-inducible protein A [Hyphomicrobiales bacterium]